MTEFTLQELKDIELNLLCVFDAFCKKHNIQYFLSNGTLLGAVKYKGHIPWDDDLDIFVPREDYNHLLEVFKDTEQYRLYAFERNSDYRYPFAKLCDMTTKKVEKGVISLVDLGVDIDIFPLDAWDSDIKKARREALRIRQQMFFLGLSKTDKVYSRTRTKYIVKLFLRVYCKIVGSKYFVKNIIRKSTNQQDTKYLGCKAWCIYRDKEIIPAEVFSETIEVEFEGHKFPAPIGYDTYLRSLYGDYEKDPPKEKQKTHHRFRAYRR